MSSEPIGIVDGLQARRAAVVRGLSPMAKHQAFPKVYAKPLPFDRSDDAERQELHRLRLENTNLKAKVSGLEARVEKLLLTQNKMTDLVARKITINDAFPRASVERIVNIVAKHWDIDARTLRDPIRLRKIVRPRQACYWLMLERLHLSFNNIGRVFNRDHTTVMTGVHAARRLFDNDADWRQRYDASLAELKSAETEGAGRP